MPAPAQGPCGAAIYHSQPASQLQAPQGTHQVALVGRRLPGHLGQDLGQRGLVLLQEFCDLGAHARGRLQHHAQLLLLLRRSLGLGGRLRSGREVRAGLSSSLRRKLACVARVAQAAVEGAAAAGAHHGLIIIIMLDHQQQAPPTVRSAHWQASGSWSSRCGSSWSLSASAAAAAASPHPADEGAGDATCTSCGRQWAAPRGYGWLARRLPAGPAS